MNRYTKFWIFVLIIVVLLCLFGGNSNADSDSSFDCWTVITTLQLSEDTAIQLVDIDCDGAVDVIQKIKYYDGSRQLKGWHNVSWWYIYGEKKK
jgi:hypothetical protein